MVLSRVRTGGGGVCFLVTHAGSVGLARLLLSRVPVGAGVGMSLTAEKFLDFVERSGLVEKDQLTPALDAIKQSDPTAFEDGERLAERLIETKLLTRWQCDSLLKGKYKPFFLGQYKLQGLLGTGGISSVYLAEHTMMHCPRAIKVLPISRVNDSSYLARFKQEATAAS